MVKIDDFFSRVTLKFDGSDLEKQEGHLFYATSSCVHHFVAIGEFKLESGPEKPNMCQNRQLFYPCDIEIWRMIWKNKKGTFSMLLQALCIIS